MKIYFSALVILTSFLSQAQCNGTEPVIDLGPDTITICNGQPLTLTAPLGYDFYKWSNNSQSNSITVLTGGTYSVTAGILSLSGPNLVQNGDFEAGTTNTANNFTTSYVPGTGGTWGLLSNPGQYAISTSPSLVHNNFSVCSDHTTGTGNMFIANGAATANTTVWSQTIPVTAGQGYIFSYWVANALNDPAVAQLQLYINNQPISTISSPSSTACIWTQFTGTWVAGANPNAVLRIVNQSTAGAGNDFSIDDIVFRTICTNTETIVVNVNSVGVIAGPNVTICEGDTANVVATTNSPNNVLTWAANTTPGATLSTTLAGNYTVTAVSPFGCTNSASMNVIVKPMNWEIGNNISINTDACDSTGVVIAVVDTINTSLPAPMPFTYTWSGPGAGSTNQTNNPIFSDLNAGWYYLTVTSDGCSRQDSVEVVANNAPIAAISGGPLTGYIPSSPLFDNNSQFATSYKWIWSNGDTLNINVPATVGNTFTDTGAVWVMLIAYNGNCSDTTFLSMYYTQEPVIVVPPVIPVFPVVFELTNVFTPGDDVTNKFFTFKMENIVELDVQIFNRWGNLMYQTKDPDNFYWDGRSPEGYDAEDGVYFYKYKAKGIQNENFEGNGFLHLIR
jgi:gliding motility-associated-like protein|tara:strand:- start:19724 stop:21580 length:1857 start_codon:yes stop_codon:yes gene_type:complete